VHWCKKPRSLIVVRNLDRSVSRSNGSGACGGDELSDSPRGDAADAGGGEEASAAAADGRAAREEEGADDDDDDDDDDHAARRAKPGWARAPLARPLPREALPGRAGAEKRGGRGRPRRRASDLGAAETKGALRPPPPSARSRAGGAADDEAAEVAPRRAADVPRAPNEA
jgi:hypothetical protein